MPDNFRHFVKCPSGTKAVAEIRPEYTHGLSTLIAQALHGMPIRPPELSVTITVDVRAPAFLRFYSNHGLLARLASSGCSVGGRLREMLSVARDGRGRGCKRLASALSSQPIPLFALFKSHPNPQRPMSSGPSGRRPPGNFLFGECL